MDRFAALTGLALAMTPVAAQAMDMTVVVERSPDSVEVFFGLPATGLVDVFSLPPQQLEDTTGMVAFEPLRLGTWLIGDAVLEATETQIGGVDAVFEAMSLMVHPADQPMPLYDVYDGLMAIAVCSVEPPETPTLDNLHAYVGYIAYPQDPYADMSFDLPVTGRGAVAVEIRDFRGGQLLSEQRITVLDGGQIALSAAPAPVNLAQVGLFAFMIVLSSGGAAVLLARRYLSRTPSV